MATNRKMTEWLLGELPVLVEKGVIGPEAAENLRRHYAETGEDAAAESGRSLALALAACGVLGAALVGLGVILLVAHNWDFMTRPERAVTAYLPLVAGIGLTGWAILFRPQSTAWREGSAVFLMASVGASIAMVSQTYHILSDMTGFLLIWMALTGPLAYLAGSHMVAAFYWVGLLFFAGNARSRYSVDALLYWPMAAAMLPRLWMARRANPGGPWELFLSWTLAICLCVAPPIMLAGVCRGLWILVYSGIFAIMHVAARWQNPTGGFGRAPFRAVGTVGVAVFALILSSRSTWTGISGWRVEYYTQFHWLLSFQDYALAFGLQAVALTLIAVNRAKRRFDQIPFGILPALALAGFALAANGRHSANDAVMTFNALMFNAYMLALGLWIMTSGIRERRLARMNGGLALIAMLTFARFIDSDLSIVARGVAFILLGVGFLVANATMLRRKEAAR